MEDHYFIQELIEQKCFADLSGDEKKEVLKHITEQEYVLRRQAVLDMVAFFKTDAEMLSGDNAVKEKARFILAKHSKNKGVLQYKIPLWQAAAAVLAIVFFGQLLYSGKNVQNELTAIKPIGNKKQIVYLRDTVFVERKVPTKIFVERAKLQQKDVVTQKQTEPLPTNEFQTAAENELKYMDDMNAGVQQNVYFEKDQYIQQLKNVAKPMSDQSELKQFLVVAR